MKSLTVLGLGNNRIPLALPDSIGQLSNLERLYLRGTVLSNVPSTLTALVPGLIDMDVNPDVTLPEIAKPPEEPQTQSDEKKEGEKEKDKQEGKEEKDIPKTPSQGKKRVTLSGDGMHKDDGKKDKDEDPDKKDAKRSTDELEASSSKKEKKRTEKESTGSPRKSSDSEEDESDDNDTSEEDGEPESEKEKKTREEKKLEKLKHREEKKLLKKEKKKLKKAEKERKREEKKKEMLLRSPSPAKRKVFGHKHHKVHDEFIIQEQPWKEDTQEIRKPTAFPIHIPKVR